MKRANNKLLTIIFCFLIINQFSCSSESSAGKIITVGYNDYEIDINLWDLETGDLLLSNTKIKREIKNFGYDIGYNYVKNLIVTFDEDHKLSAWNLTNGDKKWDLDLSFYASDYWDASIPHALSINDSGNLVAIIVDKTFFLIDAVKGEEIGSIGVGRVNKLCFLPHQDTVFLSTNDNHLRLFDAKSMEMTFDLYTPLPNLEYTFDAEVNYTKDLIAVLTNESTYIYSTTNEGKVWGGRGISNSGFKIQFNPAGDKFTVMNTREIVTRLGRTGKELWKFNDTHFDHDNFQGFQYGFQTFNINHEGNKLLVGFRAGEIFLLDLGTSSTLKKYHSLSDLNRVLFASNKIIATDRGGKIEVLDEKTGKLLWKTRPLGNLASVEFIE